MRISDWSSDVCSSDLFLLVRAETVDVIGDDVRMQAPARAGQTGTTLLFHQHHAVATIDTSAAVLLRHRDTQKAEFAGTQPRRAIDELLFLPALVLRHTFVFEKEIGRAHV